MERGQLRSEMARDCPAFEPMLERTEPKVSAVPAPRGHDVCHHSGAEGPPFGLMLCYQALEIHIIFERGSPHCHFALGPANYMAGPESIDKAGPCVIAF